MRFIICCFIFLFSPYHTSSCIFMALKDANRDPKSLSAAPSFLPAIAMTAALGFLGIGAYIGFKRPLQKFNKELVNEAKQGVPVKPVSPSGLLFSRVPNSQLGAGALAAKALLYGTVLCGAGAVVSVVAVSYALDVQDVSEQRTTTPRDFQLPDSHADL
jgi:hypothetical protein